MKSASATNDPDIIYPATIPFVALHVACVAVIWTGVSVSAIVLGVLLLAVRMCAVSIGYHRYFSHRAFRTSRIFQFLLALIAQSSTQRGVLWWAAIHRHHHRHSDTDADPHSRLIHGFWYSHMGWIFAKQNDRPDYSNVRDLQRYRELVWLERYPYFLPIAVVLVPCWWIAGWSGVIVGFCWSTTILYHVTFAINSVGHAHGSRPYLTGDESRNNGVLALFTFGEGWHNNHHAYQSSARLGFESREFDLGYLVLRALRRLGLVWDLREPPAAVLANAVPPGARLIEQIAREVAATMTEPCASESQVAVPQRAAGAQSPHDALLHRVQALYPRAPRQHLEPIVDRVREFDAMDAANAG